MKIEVNGFSLWQRFSFGVIPKPCPVCGILGHAATVCTSSSPAGPDWTRGRSRNRSRKNKASVKGPGAAFMPPGPVADPHPEDGLAAGAPASGNELPVKPASASPEIGPIIDNGNDIDSDNGNDANDKDNVNDNVNDNDNVVLMKAGPDPVASLGSAASSEGVPGLRLALRRTLPARASPPHRIRLGRPLPTLLTWLPLHPFLLWLCLRRRVTSCQPRAPCMAGTLEPIASSSARRKDGAKRF